MRPRILDQPPVYPQGFAFKYPFQILYCIVGCQDVFPPIWIASAWMFLLVAYQEDGVLFPKLGAGLAGFIENLAATLWPSLDDAD